MFTSSTKKESARDHLRSIVANHLGRNCVRYSWSTICGELNVNAALGLTSDERPAEGRVIDVSTEWITLKTAANKFALVDPSLVIDKSGIDVGAKVRVEPYARRRFDGRPLGSPMPSDDPRFTTIPLGERVSRLSIDRTAIQSVHLAHMIEQLEELPADARRTIAQALIDAGALTGSVDLVDPAEDDDLMAKPPSISFAVSTKLHRGRIQLALDVACDTYIVRLFAEDGTLVHEQEDIHFNELDTAMIERIDDGDWRFAKVTILAKAPKRRHVAGEFGAEAANALPTVDAA